MHYLPAAAEYVLDKTPVCLLYEILYLIAEKLPQKELIVFECDAVAIHCVVLMNVTSLFDDNTECANLQEKTALITDCQPHICDTIQ